jgi:hypothetical protein
MGRFRYDMRKSDAIISQLCLTNDSPQAMRKLKCGMRIRVTRRSLAALMHRTAIAWGELAASVCHACPDTLDLHGGLR